MDDTLTEADLQPGDILLSLGDSEISQAIQGLDGGAYSHAALWTGTTVIESTLPRVAEYPLDVSLEQHARVYVDVCRHRSSGAWTEAAVREARTFVGRPYAHGDLVMGALIVATSSWIPSKQWQVKFLMDACGFNFFMQEEPVPGPRELVTCTQLAVLAYCRAEHPIQIRPTPPARVDVGAFVRAGTALLREKLHPKETAVRSAAAGGDDEEEVDEASWRALQARIGARYTSLTGLTPLDPRESATDEGVVSRHAPPLYEAGSNWRAERVTPRYLETSPNLERKGRLRKPVERARGAG
jgi:Permuted papain-like amidase enzyme, YaeF/YiiX, C92 family